MPGEHIPAARRNVSVQRLARLRGTRKYVYRMDILERSLSYEEVTEIFVRVNSLGAKLRSSDLALAQITAKWRGALKIFQAFQEACAKDGFDLDLGIHLKNLVAFATRQSRFLTVGSLADDTLKQGWKECVSGMEFALNFLRSNVGIESPALLSSPFIVVRLGYYGHKRNYQIPPDEAQSVRHWVLVANAKGRYRYRGETCARRRRGRHPVGKWWPSANDLRAESAKNCGRAELGDTRAVAIEPEG